MSCSPAYAVLGLRLLAEAMRAQTVPFQQLVRLVEQELELALAGKTAELQEAVARTGRHLATLPHPAPPEAMRFIHHARGIRARVEIELKRCRSDIKQERAAIKQARLVSRTYLQQPRSRYTTIV